MSEASELYRSIAAEHVEKARAATKKSVKALHLELASQYLKLAEHGEQVGPMFIPSRNRQGPNLRSR